MARHETPYAGAWDAVIRGEHDVVEDNGYTLDASAWPWGEISIRVCDRDGNYMISNLTPQDAHRIARKLDTLAWTAECATCPENHQED